MNLNALIDRFEGQKIVVLGDLVADIFIHGEISRVSREAPVLILSHRNTQVVPGGAANAVQNLWALGARPLPVGIVGNDPEGRQVVEHFESNGIDTSGIRTVEFYSTPSKTRILAGVAHAYHHQVLRIDRGKSVDDANNKKGTFKIMVER